MDGYVKETPESQKWFERAKKVLPAGVTYSIRDIEPYPFYVDHAEGVKIVDVDGNEYTDYWVGHGALILGHSPNTVVEAVSEQLPNGTHYGFAHKKEVELAERIVDMIPCAEMVRFTSSGTEANMYAVRLARSYTERIKIAKIRGGWHGGYDVLHKAVHPPFDIPESAGLDPKALENTMVLPFNDLDAAREAVDENDLACIIVEPVMGAAGFITPEPGYLEGLRDICDDSDTLLIFDEVITGFRLSEGGAQGYYDVVPDITVMGKILGGGFPIGALCGLKDIFELIDHRKHPDMEERSAHGGTFTGNPISTTAGIATLDYLKKKKVYEKINPLGERIREGLRDICERYTLPASVTGVGSMFALHFQAKPPKKTRATTLNNPESASAYYDHMLEGGITYMSRDISHCFICEPHSQRDVDEYLTLTEEFFKNYKG